MRSSIGYSDFGEIIDNNCIWVDKSLMIKQVMDDAKVLLMTRPRRFGKTLNLSMLHYFFAKEVHGRSTQGMFDSYHIAKAGDDYMQQQGYYPVINISLKEIKETQFENAYARIVNLIKLTFAEHDVLLDSHTLRDGEKKTFKTLLNGIANAADVKDALKLLSIYLYQHYQVKPIMLIDEYDTPIHAAYLNDYFDPMIEFMRAFLGAALKDNPYYHKAVITGILRVAKEDLFSGVNNLEVYSLLDREYAQYFGFTEVEVEALFKQAQLDKNLDDIKNWYNGYRIGDTVIYNPWSILMCLKKEGELKPYWVNTSDNALIEKSFQYTPSEIIQDFDALMQNKSISAYLYDHMLFNHLEGDKTALLTLLFMSGYLKAEQAIPHGDEYAATISIPNQEVYSLFHRIIEKWFFRPPSPDWMKAFLKHLCTGDMEQFEKALQDIAVKFFSQYDVHCHKPENFYHGFILGITAALTNKYIISSNQEAGFGRYDLALIPKTPIDKMALLFEFKSVKAADDNTIKQAAQAALAQIDEKRYATAIQQSPCTQILKIGIAFSGKHLQLAHQLMQAK